MNRKQLMLILVVCGAVGFLAVTAVTASGQTSSTPLYTFRMEQASSEMSFLPTERNTFLYIAEKGHTVTYDVTGCCNAVPLITGGAYTCGTCGRTCPNTCYSTCVSTCSSTCVSTCPETCVNTCHTCVSTCSSTCVSTCSSTCVSTCPYTCGNTCANTCWDTCEEPCP